MNNRREYGIELYNNDELIGFLAIPQNPERDLLLAAPQSLVSESIAHEVMAKYHELLAGEGDVVLIYQQLLTSGVDYSDVIEKLCLESPFPSAPNVYLNNVGKVEIPIKDQEETFKQLLASRGFPDNLPISCHPSPLASKG